LKIIDIFQILNDFALDEFFAESGRMSKQLIKLYGNERMLKIQTRATNILHFTFTVA